MNIFFTALLCAILLFPFFLVVVVYAVLALKKVYGFLYGGKTGKFIAIEVLEFVIPNVSFTSLLVFLTGVEMQLADLVLARRLMYLFVFMVTFFVMVAVARVKEKLIKK